MSTNSDSHQEQKQSQDYRYKVNYHLFWHRKVMEIHSSSASRVIKPSFERLRFINPSEYQSFLISPYHARPCRTMPSKIRRSSSVVMVGGACGAWRTHQVMPYQLVVGCCSLTLAGTALLFKNHSFTVQLWTASRKPQWPQWPTEREPG